MIQPTFSRILRKLLRSLFGSPLWHPGVGIAYDTQAGPARGKIQRVVMCCVFTVCEAAGCSSSACGRRAVKHAVDLLATGKGS